MPPDSLKGWSLVHCGMSGLPNILVRLHSDIRMKITLVLRSLRFWKTSPERGG